jgi:hypothetical protein
MLCQTKGMGKNFWFGSAVGFLTIGGTQLAMPHAFSRVYWVSVGNPMFKFGGISIVTGEPFFTECFLVSGYVAEQVLFLTYKFHPIKVGQRSSSVPHE